jgi:hypothetical protein
MENLGRNQLRHKALPHEILDNINKDILGLNIVLLTVM